MQDGLLYHALLNHLHRVVCFCIISVIVFGPGVLRLRDFAAGFLTMNLTWIFADLFAVVWIFNHLKTHEIISFTAHLRHISKMIGWNILLDFGYLLIGIVLWQFRHGDRPGIREGLALGVIWQGFGLLFLDSWFFLQLLRIG
jgi:hypothetical protein